MRARAHLTLNARRLWLAAALLAVLAMQSLGLGHGVSHWPRGTSALAAEAPADGGWTWGHALGSLACEQLDQLAHGAAPPSLPTVFGGCMLPDTLALHPLQAGHAAEPWRRYQARAPPRG